MFFRFTPSMKSLVRDLSLSVSQRSVSRNGDAEIKFTVPRKRAARHRGRVKAFPKVSMVFLFGEQENRSGLFVSNTNTSREKRRCGRPWLY